MFVRKVDNEKSYAARKNEENEDVSEIVFLPVEWMVIQRRFCICGVRGRLAQSVSQMNVAAMARVRSPLQTMNSSLYNVEIYDYTTCGCYYKVTI